MPPKKKSTKAAQLLPQPAQSDYDTDAANITDAALAMDPQPPPDRSIAELNMLVLRRYLPDIEHIISIAPFAVVYLFSPDTQQWEKSGHEGTLFVCQLSAEATGHARYKVFILNRKSLDNFLVELTSGEDIEITSDYVILQIPGEEDTPNIYGLWILPDEDSALGARDMVANAIQDCAVRAEHGQSEIQNGHSATPSYNLDGVADMEEDATSAMPQPTGQTIDLMALFGKPPPSSENHPQRPPNMSHQFSSNPDTDFFRTVSNAAPPVQQQQPSHRNDLLDLFNSAKKG